MKSPNDVRMMVREKHLNIREADTEGTVIHYVADHGGAVWFVKQDNGIACYYYDEFEEIK